MKKEIVYDLGIQDKGPEYIRGVSKLAAWHRECAKRRLVAAMKAKKGKKK